MAAAAAYRMPGAQPPAQGPSSLHSGAAATLSSSGGGGHRVLSKRYSAPLQLQSAGLPVLRADAAPPVSPFDNIDEVPVAGIRGVIVQKEDPVPAAYDHGGDASYERARAAATIAPRIDQQELLRAGRVVREQLVSREDMLSSGNLRSEPAVMGTQAWNEAAALPVAPLAPAGAWDGSALPWDVAEDVRLVYVGPGASSKHIELGW
eukprot:TRINITY_DN9198_c0_g1_i1.p1 TRINITY_DN9198_c0_g1~~TRINITY_DN9198_c0_g1_i1.p1  ORF type:complete len:206 (+),score=51.16 TRINITY_DN9198_c0_g1_i1:74-691(+)